MSQADPSEVLAGKQLRGLRANSFAAVVILLIEYGLGMWVNLESTLPGSDSGSGLAGGFGRAVSGGPVGLSVHAVLGVLLPVTAVTALIRSLRLRRRMPTVATTIGLLAILTAAVTGARFVGTGSGPASLSMALATGVAILSYAFTLLVTGTVEPVSSQRAASGGSPT